MMAVTSRVSGGVLGVETLPVLTLLGLRGLGDVDGELAAEGIHAHHSRVGGAAQRRKLVVGARNAVESFSEVSSTLQDDLLQESITYQYLRSGAPPTVGAWLTWLLCGIP